LGCEQSDEGECLARRNRSRIRHILTVRLGATPARCANARLVPNELAANAIVPLSLFVLFCLSLRPRELCF